MLSVQQTSVCFEQLFQHPQNTKCIVCTNPSMEWVCSSNAVFLCLSCAAEYKNLGLNFCHIKSVNLERWTEREVEILRLGGNQRFFEYMETYSLNSINFQDRLGTRAAVYYRDHLQNQVDEIASPEPPTVEEGRVIVFARNLKGQEEKRDSTFLQTTKTKLSSAYDKTKRFTSFTFQKIGDKLKSEELKEGVSNFGTKTKDVAVKGYNGAKAGFSYLYQGIKNKIKK